MGLPVHWAAQSDIVAAGRRDFVRTGEFFAKGSGKLAPWTQKQAAKSLGVSEPTLSRTVREKYLQCRWGIFPLSYFFSRHMAAEGFGTTDKGRMAEREEAANQEETAVQAEMVNRMETGKDPREAIRHLIKTENPRSRSATRAVRKTGGSGDHAVAADCGEIPGRNGNPGCIRAEVLLGI